MKKLCQIKKMKNFECCFYYENILQLKIEQKSNLTFWESL